MKVKREVLSFEVITLAIHGDVIAMNLVLKHFEPYIIKFSQKTLLDELGNPHLHVEPEIKRTLETKLI
ncbi:helix-turn-helix domain-containing protein [Listeria welshimeri]|nr:helix-turn-helix domain-containing protein [Listeria welshimeri]